MISGVIFDMDGVIFDTEVLYERFWCLAAKELGYTMTVDDVRSIRSTDSGVARKIIKSRLGDEFDYDGVKALRVSLMADYINANGITIKPGIKELLDFLKVNRIRTALATTSNYKRMTMFMEKAELLKYFDYCLTGDRVLKGKPDPLIYTLAAKGIGLRPCECIAVEDSKNGIISAYNAGCNVIMAVDRDEPDEDMKSKCIAVVHNAFRIIEIISEKLKS